MFCGPMFSYCIWSLFGHSNTFSHCLLPNNFNHSLLVDGSYLLTCGSDKKLKLWNPLTGLLLKTYGGHANEVTDAAGSCDRYTHRFFRL